MLLLAWLVRQPATWLALPLVGVSLLYVLGYPPATADGYGLAATSAATIALGFISPVVGGICAWEAGRLRRANWWSFPWVRGRGAIALAASGFAIAVGVAALLITASANGAYLGAGPPDLRILLVASSAIAAAGIFGCAVGVWLPPVVSAPTSVLVLYLWTAYPRALEPLWLRHLNGSFASCCALDADLAWSAVGAALLISLVIVVAAGTAIGERQSARRVGVSVTFGVAAIAVAVASVSSLGPDPAMPRDRGALRCAGDRPSICLWLEHEPQRSMVAGAVAPALQRWISLGLEVPVTVSESAAGGELPINFSRESSEWDIVHSLGYSYVVEHCGADSPAGELAHAWLDAVAGMPSRELGQRYDYPPPPGEVATLTVLHRIRSMQPQQQSQWFAAACKVSA